MANEDKSRRGLKLRDPLLDELLRHYVHGDDRPEPEMLNGDPKVTLKLTVLMTLVGTLVAGGVTWASTYFGVRDEVVKARISSSEEIRSSLEKHALTDHPGSATRGEMRELKDDLREIKAKLDRLSEDVAALKERRK